jgi:TetR/AcrR family transcriptional regulator
LPLVRYQKEKILESCLSTFAQYGYNKASMQMLAEAAGVSKALLFHHFKNKKNLYMIVLSDSWEKVILEIDFTTIFKREFFSALIEIGIVRFEYYRRNPDAYKIWWEAVYATPAELKQDIVKKYGNAAENIKKGWSRMFDKVYLRDSVDRGQVFRLIMFIVDYFEKKFLTELAGVKNLDKNRLLDFVAERNGFLSIIKNGIEKTRQGNPQS